MTESEEINLNEKVDHIFELISSLTDDGTDFKILVQAVRDACQVELDNDEEE